MCGVCGCDGEEIKELKLEDQSPKTETINLEKMIFEKNNSLAQKNRDWFQSKNIKCLNMMSSPGSGKTTLLVKTINDLKAYNNFYVLEGDQETDADAKRIAQTGCEVYQINTGTGCHLEADMVWHGLSHVKPMDGSTLIIENVGNLVCPALFDLGEDTKVVIASVTEGEDKPLKYPHMFKEADYVVLNKIDLLPYLDFDMGEFMQALKMVNSKAPLLCLSAKTGEGMQAWHELVRNNQTQELYV